MTQIGGLSDGVPRPDLFTPAIQPQLQQTVSSLGASLGSLASAFQKAAATITSGQLSLPDFASLAGGKEVLSLPSSPEPPLGIPLGGRGAELRRLIGGGFVSRDDLAANLLRARMEQAPALSTAATAAAAEPAQLTAATAGALSSLGLGSLSPAAQSSFVAGVGALTVEAAEAMPLPFLGKAVLDAFAQSPAFLDQAGAHLVQGAFGRMETSSLGQQFLGTIGGQSPEHWGRLALGSLGPRYFSGFDPRSLAKFPDRALVPFGNQLVASLRQMSPLDIGRSLLADIGAPLRQHLGGLLLGTAGPSIQTDIGRTLLPLMAQNPLSAGMSLLESMGSVDLAQLGGSLFKNMSGLATANPLDLAQKLTGALFPAGKAAQNIIGAIGKFALGNMKSLAGGILGQFGPDAMKNVASNIFSWAKDSGLGKIGMGILDKIGGGILGKLGGPGKITSGILSALNGDFNPGKMLQVGLACAPGIGPVYAALSSLPVVGPLLNNVVSGIGKVLGNVPIVGPLLKGVGKVAGAIVKGVGKAAGAVAKGVGKVVSTIGKGIKKVGETIGKGIKKVGNAIAKGAKKVWNAIKKY